MITIHSAQLSGVPTYKHSSAYIKPLQTTEHLSLFIGTTLGRVGPVWLVHVAAQC